MSELWVVVGFNDFDDRDPEIYVYKDLENAVEAEIVLSSSGFDFTDSQRVKVPWGGEQ